MTRETATGIETEAAHWAVRLEANDSPAIRAALASWLDGDPRRKGALLQAQAAAAMIGDALTAHMPVTMGAAPPAPRLMTRRRLLAGACVTTLVASVGVGVALSLSPKTYRTTTGEIRKVPLGDGSIAVVNTQSDLSVSFSRDARTVRMAEGEAWFQVAHDKARPFTVESGAVRVRAVGTAFSVRRRANGSDIVVSEGVVELWTVGAEQYRRRIAAGDRAFMAEDALRPTTVVASDVDRDLIWREGKIDLAGQTLAYAVEEFNRYNDRKLVIADPALANERFYGVFSVDDPADFAISLHDSMKVPVEVSNPNEIRIGAPLR